VVFSKHSQTGLQRERVQMLDMLIEITLPLVGTFSVPFIVMPLFFSGLFLVVLFIGITLDNKKEGN
jgi:hypothetical protein